MEPVIYETFNSKQKFNQDAPDKKLNSFVFELQNFGFKKVINPQNEQTKVGGGAKEK